MKKVIYCYRMTHDYGINPCAFTVDYTPTPDLLTLGGCKAGIRTNIDKYWKAELCAGTAEVYLMAISGHSNDLYPEKGDSKSRDKWGREYIGEYQHLMYVAKISDVISMPKYLKSNLYKGRRDTVDKSCKAQSGGNCIDNNGKVLLSQEFSYHGCKPKKLEDGVLEFFCPPRNYRKYYIVNEADEERYEPLISTINDSLAEKALNCPYHPIYVNEKDRKSKKC